MYGMVNKAMKDMIVAQLGDQAWRRICKRAGLETGVFITNQTYPDQLTYDMVGAASEETGRSVDDLLENFGRHWVNFAVATHPAMMHSGGRTLREFLVNLPNFHTRVGLIFPKVTPPEFECTDVAEHSLVLHYRSHRGGLAPFVGGLIAGLADMFGTEARIRFQARCDAGDDHDELHIDWATT